MGARPIPEKGFSSSLFITYTPWTAVITLPIQEIWTAPMLKSPSKMVLNLEQILTAGRVLYKVFKQVVMVPSCQLTGSNQLVVSAQLS